MNTPNLNYIDQLAGDSKSFRDKLIGILKTELPEEVASLNLSLEKKLFTEAGEMVHKIKHKISILGMTEAYELAVNYEKELRAENNRLASQFKSVLSTMSHFIENL